MYFLVSFCFVSSFFPWRPRRADYREIVSATVKKLVIIIIIIIDIIIVNKLES